MVGLIALGSIQKNNELLSEYFFNNIPLFVGRECIVIDRYKTSKLEKQGFAVPVLKFDMIGIAKSTNSWKAYYKACVKFLKDNNIDTLITVKTLMRDTFNIYDDSFLTHFLDVRSVRDEYGMTYVSSLTTFCFIEFIEAASEVCDNVYQYVTDPQEVDFSQSIQFKNFRRLYYNKCERFGSTLMPYYEFGLLLDDMKPASEKLVDFTFYCSAVTEDRRWLYDKRDELTSIPNSDVSVNGHSDKKKFISQHQYMYMLSASKFTMVTKPYDHLAFGWTRFCEAVFNGCVPLVMSDCEFQDIETTFPDVTDIIKSELMFDDFSDIEGKMKKLDSKRRQILNDILNCQTVKMVTDIQWLQERWQKLPGLSC